jgi:hypothetical protein
MEIMEEEEEELDEAEGEEAIVGDAEYAGAIPEGEVEGSRLMALRGSACLQALEAEGSHPMALGAARANLRSRRGDGFGIIISKTRGGMCYRHNLTGPRDGLRAT